MNPAKQLPIIAFFILFISSCEKDLQHTLPYKSNFHVDFPTNYLQPGNYWIYEHLTSPAFNDPTFDSVVVESFIVTEQNDTFYCLAHHQSGAQEGLFKEYRRITPEGLLIDTSGRVFFDYSGMPVNTDSSGRNAGKCNWYWSAWSQSENEEIIIDSFKLIGTKVWRTEYPDPICSLPIDITGSESYFHVRGVGLVNEQYHSFAGGFTNTMNRSITLKRFFVKRTY